MSSIVSTDVLRESYLELLKTALTRMIGREQYALCVPSPGTIKNGVWRFMERCLRSRNLKLVSVVSSDDRVNGKRWPADAETMVGLNRLSAVQSCVVDILRNGVPGDLMETGVWRGGTCILIAGLLKAYGADNRCVWLADSFEGLPKPAADKYPEDTGVYLWRFPELSVSEAEVRANFVRYGLFGPNIKFLKGWFRDTMQSPPMERLALLRLDGDMYESTIQVLEGSYGRVSPGGYVIVDDYGVSLHCKSAVDQFRAAHHIEAPLQQVDWSCVLWQKREPPEVDQAAVGLDE